MQLRDGETYSSQSFDFHFEVKEITQTSFGSDVAIIDIIRENTKFDFFNKSKLTKHENPKWEGYYMLPLDLVQLLVK